VGLTACDGDDDSGAPSSGLRGKEAKRVEDAARAVVVDPEKSCDLLTEKALAEYTGLSGDRAKAQCEKQIRRTQLPKKARVVVLSLSRDTASAAFTTDRRVTGAMKLVKREGRWLMDGVTTISG
jgi:hypothetical protein